MINKLFYKTLAEMIEKETGIVYTESDFDRLTFRVEKLKELLKVSTDEELLNVLKHSPSSNVQSLLVSTSTNNETSFFRDKKPFEIFTNQILPSVISAKTIKHVKIWCAASSSGQEPYSIAMSCKESPDMRGVHFDIKATDIDLEILGKAKKGLYNQTEIQRGLPVQYLLKYFEKLDENSWSVKNEIKSTILFEPFNLLSPHYPKDEFDIIFCRNVLIYQSLESKTKVINEMYSSLRTNGYLILGGAENLIGIKSDFKKVPFEDIVVYQKS